MDYKKEDCIKDTKEHIAQVREFMILFANELLQRALVHDKSKLESPEHYENGIKDMGLADIVEMICDWKAATMRHVDGDIRKSIVLNQDRFNYSDDLKLIFLNTANMFE